MVVMFWSVELCLWIDEGVHLEAGETRMLSSVMSGRVCVLGVTFLMSPMLLFCMRMSGWM